MAVKLVLFLLVLAIVLSVALIAAFWYFKETAEMKHEQEMTKMEQAEELFER